MSRIFTGLLLGVLILISVVAGAQTYTVTSSEDSGPGSLREAITKANAEGAGGTIVFALDAGESQVITLRTALPEVTAYNLTVNGTDQKTNVVIALDGNGEIDSPGIRFSEATSSAVNIDFVNFVDREMFRDNPNDGVVLKVYPNPASRSTVTVEVNNIPEVGTPMLIELLDMNGNSINSKFMENESTDVKTNLELQSAVPIGTYVICVRIAERTYKQVLMMQ